MKAGDRVKIVANDQNEDFFDIGQEGTIEYALLPAHVYYVRFDNGRTYAAAHHHLETI